MLIKFNASALRPYEAVYDYVDVATFAFEMNENTQFQDRSYH